MTAFDAGNRRNRRLFGLTCLLLLCCIHRHNVVAFLSYARPARIRPSPLYAKRSKNKETVHHRAPYHLGVRPFLGHRRQQKQSNDADLKKQNATSLQHEDTTNATLLDIANHTASQSAETLLANNVTSSANSSTTLNVTTAESTTNSSIQATNTTSASKTKRKKASQSLFSSIQKLSEPDFTTWPHEFTTGMKPKKKKTPTKNATRVALKNKDDVLTVADLEEILLARGYVRESDLFKSPSKDTTASRTSTDKSVSPKTSGGGGKIAFPQSSVLSYKGLTYGSTVAAGFLGMLLSMTVMPNLWLAGILFGSFYGYEISKDYKDKQPTNVLARGVIEMGRRLAKSYLSVYDFFQQIWFMYKTGQLSYQYYKRYAKLDDRFAITDKLDAWNARFVEGKKKFDQWEQQNEVGRRVLAGFRTAWLIEEQSMQKHVNAFRQSKYRIVQYFYDVVSWFGRCFTSVWNAITGGGESDLREILKGIRINISQESRIQEIGPRIGAAILAVVTVSLIGALYAIAPKFLVGMAITTGVIWPTWVPELLDRVKLQLDEFKAKGRGEEFQVEAGGPTALSQFGMYDKKRYYFYRRQDGSKRWYRTGRPAFRSDEMTKSDGGGGGLLGGVGGGTSKKKKESKKGKKGKS